MPVLDSLVGRDLPLTVLKSNLGLVLGILKRFNLLLNFIYSLIAFVIHGKTLLLVLLLFGKLKRFIHQRRIARVKVVRVIEVVLLKRSQRVLNGDSGIVEQFIIDLVVLTIGLLLL